MSETGTTEKPISDVRAIVNYFFGGKSTGHMADMKALTKEDKEQLGEAIRNGSLTY